MKPQVFVPRGADGKPIERHWNEVPQNSVLDKFLAEYRPWRSVMNIWLERLRGRIACVLTHYEHNGWVPHLPDYCFGATQCAFCHRFRPYENRVQRY